MKPILIIYLSVIAFLTIITFFLPITLIKEKRSKVLGVPKKKHYLLCQYLVEQSEDF